MIRLHEVAKVIPGYPFRGKISEKAHGNAHAVQMRDVDNDGKVSWGGLVRTNLPGRKKPDWLSPGDILFLLRGNHNFAVYLHEVPVPAVSSPHFFLIRVTEHAGLLPEFLAWQLNQPPAQRYFNISAEGSLQRSIKRSVLDLFQVTIPDLKTQKTIIDLNNSAMHEMDLYRKLIENRRQMIRAIATSVLQNKTV